MAMKMLNKACAWGRMLAGLIDISEMASPG